MGKRVRSISAERVRTVLDYDPETGVFLWKKPTSNRVKIGSVAGGLDEDGYRAIGIDGFRWQASALAVLYVTGIFPSELVDHIDRDPSNDRFNNLRCADYHENAFNVAAHSDNLTGLKGIHLHKPTGQWRAQIRASGSRVHIGLFPTKEAAHAAYISVAKELHGEFFYGGSDRQA